MGGRAAVGGVVAVWLGLVLGAHASAVAGVLALVACVLAAAVSVRARPSAARVALLVALAAAALARGEAAAALDRARSASMPRAEAIVRVRVMLAEPPRRESGDPAATAVLLAANPPLPAGVRLRVRLPATCTAEWGDRLDLLARFEPPAPRRNPGGFDAAAAARSAGVAGWARAYTAGPPVTTPVRVAIAPLARVRRALERVYAARLSPSARELVTPLVLGDRSAMRPETDAALRGSGLVHLIALSGLHVVWMAAVVRGLAAAAGAGVRARALAGFAAALAYALVAGPIPSLLRAVFAEAAAAAAALAGRALDPLQALALAALALLAAEPRAAFDLGFQLSCAATLGLVLLVAPTPAPRAAKAWDPWRVRVARGALVVASRALPPLAATLGAQAAALPLLMGRFHAIGWTGLLANLLAVPVAELLLAAAWLLGASELAWPGSGRVWAGACEVLAEALARIAAAAAALPGALAPAGGEAALAWIAAAGVALLALAAPERALDARLRPRRVARTAARVLGGALLASAVLAALTAPERRPPRGAWWLVALDVGQGDAIALAFDDGWWLVDAGPRSTHGDAGEQVVLPFLRWAAVRRLRALVVTHDDNDHAGGAAAVRRSVPVDTTWVPAPRDRVPGPARRFAGARVVARGVVMRESDPPVRVLWPPWAGEPDEALAERGDNAASVVLEVGEGRARALLTADADSLVEAVLAVAPGVALLKAGHHGSGSSSGAAFARQLRADVALISAGRRNSYGHPHPGALARLEAAGTRIARTDREGALWFEMDANGARRVEWRRGEPGRECVPLAAAPAPRR